MKRSLLLLAAYLLLSVATSAQHTPIHAPNAEVRSVAGFHALRVATGIHLWLTQGVTSNVVVSAATPEYRDRIRTEVKDGVLEVYYDTEGWKFWKGVNGKDLNVYICCSRLDGLHASSGAQVEVDGTLKSPILAMDFSSGSGFRGKVEVSDLRVDQGSGANSTISGTVTTLRVSASSGSCLHGFDLQATRCDVSASSGGSIDISVEKEMDVSAHSGGHVSYQGQGVVRDVHTGSGGSVSKR